MSFRPANDVKVISQESVPEPISMTDDSDLELVEESSSMSIQLQEESVVVSSETKSKRKRKQKMIADLGFSDKKVPKKVRDACESFVSDTEVIKTFEIPSKKVNKSVLKSRKSSNTLAETLELSTDNPKQVSDSLASDVKAKSVQDNAQPVFANKKAIKQQVTKNVPRSKKISSPALAKTPGNLLPHESSATEEPSLQIPEGAQTVAVHSANVIKHPIIKSVAKSKKSSTALTVACNKLKNVLVNLDSADVKAVSQKDDTQAVVTTSNPSSDPDASKAILSKTSEVPTVKSKSVKGDSGAAIVDKKADTVEETSPTLSANALTNSDTKTAPNPRDVSAVLTKGPQNEVDNSKIAITIATTSKANNNRLSLPEMSKNIKRKRPFGLKYNVNLNSKSVTKKVSNSLSDNPVANVDKPPVTAETAVVSVDKPVATTNHSLDVGTSKSLDDQTGDSSTPTSSGMDLKTKTKPEQYQITISSSNLNHNFGKPLTIDKESKTSVQAFDGSNVQDKQSAMIPQNHEPIKKSRGRPATKVLFPNRPKPKQFTMQGNSISIKHPEITKQPQQTEEPSVSKSIILTPISADDDEKVNCLVCSDTFDTYPAMRSHMKVEHNLDQNIAFFH